MSTAANTAGSAASVYVGVAGIRASLPYMTRKPERKLTFEERARVANLARQEKSTPQERSEAARRAAQGLHSPPNLARRILRAYREGKMSREDVDEVGAILSHIPGLIKSGQRGGQGVT